MRIRTGECVLQRLRGIISSIIFITQVILVILGIFFLTENCYSFSKGESVAMKKGDVILLEDYLTQLRTRIWQLEKRLQDKPHDVSVMEEILKLREDYLEQLNIRMRQLEKRLQDKPHDVTTMEEFLKLRKDYLQQLNIMISQFEKRTKEEPDDNHAKGKVTQLRNNSFRANRLCIDKEVSHKAKALFIGGKGDDVLTCSSKKIIKIDFKLKKSGFNAGARIKEKELPDITVHWYVDAFSTIKYHIKVWVED